MKKKICLIMCLALIVTAFASVAFARKESCSYCGADMECYDVSNEYVVRRYTAKCTIATNRLDEMVVYGTDYFYQCSNRYCLKESFTNTVTRTVRVCTHEDET